jgi:hypothetical protein
MARWRTRAYETFGFRPGSYSYALGCVTLLDDLLALARRASRKGDEATLGRVFGNVAWAAAQKGADRLASAVDLAFFLPGFRDPEMCAVLKARLPEGLISEKWRVLMEGPDSHDPPPVAVGHLASEGLSMREPDFEELLRGQARVDHPSDKFTASLRGRGVSEKEADLLDCVMPKKAAFACGLWLNTEKQVIREDSPETGGIPQALDAGLLIVGSGPGGDLVAVDLRERPGVVGLINHEQVWDEVPIRSIFAPIAKSFDDLAHGWFEGDVPMDYHDAIRKIRGGQA